jgi:hypothetical protein
MPENRPEVVYGAEAIGDVICEPDLRRVFYMLAKGQVPGARKVGRIWQLSVPTYRREIHGEAA